MVHCQRNIGDSETFRVEDTSSGIAMEVNEVLTSRRLSFRGCPGTACSEMARKSRLKHVGFWGLQDIEFWMPGRQNYASATLVDHWGSHL